jgi:tetratricopeptide (TPR) repeat protein
LAAKAVATVPDSGLFWNTVGVAEYRAGNWDAAIQAIERSHQLLGDGHASHNLFFLAMSYWQLGRKDEARAAYDQAVSWMQKTRPTDEELLRFCAEAASLLGNEGTTDEPGESVRQEPTKEE